MEADIPDKDLMRSVAAGDLDAFEQLVLRHQQTAWRTAYRLVADYQVAEDLAQDAFLKIFQAADRYRPTAAFRTYLHRILVRLCVDYLRKRRPVPKDSLDSDVEPCSSPKQRVLQMEQSQVVQRAITGLPPNQRTAMVLRYYEGLSGREIAAAMEISVKAVERLLARGRASLQRPLSRYLEE